MGKNSHSRNKTAFLGFYEEKAYIEQAFGGELDWQGWPTRIGCRICVDVDGGWKTQGSDWPVLQDQLFVKMMKLESALKVSIQPLKI